MSEGRTYEQIDAMSWHDVLSILRYQSKTIPQEKLLRAIAEALGVKFSSSVSAPDIAAPTVLPSQLKDPTEDLRAAFADAKFPTAVGSLVIPERLKYAE